MIPIQMNTISRFWGARLLACALVGSAVSAQWLPAQPSPRVGHVMTSAGSSGGVFLFGGGAGNAPRAVDSLWLFDGMAWNSKSIAGPQSREMAAAVYDTRRSVLVVYGGSGLGTRTKFGDTWEWNGRGWQERSVITPGPRDHHAMAYDEARGNAVMFGGRNANSGRFPNETWTWDGTVWTLADTSTGPGGLGHHAMAYDSRRRRVILFGGDGPDRPATGDTWEWDGQKWERIEVEGPGARTRHRMAYDPERGVTVLFGGQIGSGRASTFPQDTWTWDGKAWKVSAVVGPPTRYVHAMAYDSARHRIVLFGGGQTSPPYRPMSDVWEWNGNTWEHVGGGN